MERRDMLGAFVRYGMDQGEAERGGLLQVYVIPSIYLASEYMS